MTHYISLPVSRPGVAAAASRATLELGQDNSASLELLVTTLIISSAVTSSNADSVMHGRSDITEVHSGLAYFGDFVPEEISKVFSCVNIGSGRLCLQQNIDLDHKALESCMLAAIVVDQ